LSSQASVGTLWIFRCISKAHYLSVWGVLESVTSSEAS